MIGDAYARILRLLFFSGTFAPVLFLTGCDPVHGAETIAYIGYPINIGCVDDAIKRTAGAGDVEHHHYLDEKSELFPVQGIIKTRVDYWIYGPGREIILQFITSNSGEPAEYHNGHTKMGNDDHKAEPLLPLVRDVDRSVEQRCGLPVMSRGKLQKF